MDPVKVISTNLYDLGCACTDGSLDEGEVCEPHAALQELERSFHSRDELIVEQGKKLVKMHSMKAAMRLKDEGLVRMTEAHGRLRRERDALLAWCDLNPEWYARAVAEMLREGSFLEHADQETHPYP